MKCYILTTEIGKFCTLGADAAKARSAFTKQYKGVKIIMAHAMANLALETPDWDTCQKYMYLVRKYKWIAQLLQENRIAEIYRNNKPKWEFQWAKPTLASMLDPEHDSNHWQKDLNIKSGYYVWQARATNSNRLVFLLETNLSTAQSAYKAWVKGQLYNQPDQVLLTLASSGIRTAVLDYVHWVNNNKVTGSASVIHTDQLGKSDKCVKETSTKKSSTAPKVVKKKVVTSGLSIIYQLTEKDIGALVESKLEYYENSKSKLDKLCQDGLVVYKGKKLSLQELTKSVQLNIEFRKYISSYLKEKIEEAWEELVDDPTLMSNDPQTEAIMDLIVEAVEKDDETVRKLQSNVKNSHDPEKASIAYLKHLGYKVTK